MVRLVNKIDDVAVICADPAAKFVFVVVTVAVELVSGETPEIVTKPLPLIATTPETVAVPAYANEES